MKTRFKFILLLSIFVIVSCNRNNYKSGKISQATGIKLGEDGFDYKGLKFKDKNTPPGLIFVQGGTFTKGNSKDNVMHDWNNTPSQQYVRSFFMDETEVTNLMYLEYLDWLKEKYGSDENLKKVYEAALPDTLAWRNPLGFNEDMVNNYLRHPAFKNHPVVGVSWQQATNFAKWRTNRVNEQILIREGYLNDSVQYSNFNTKAYLFNPSANETNADSLYASVETGLLLPEYRLPTETEWEYAALGLNELSEKNNYRGKKKFPWDGEYTRSQKKKNLGDQLANFKLGEGDYGGIAGWSEIDGSGITTQVDAYPANSFGLYGMGGNVAEWVADVYRPIIDEDASDFNYYRGNVYKKINKDGNVYSSTYFDDSQEDSTWRKLPDGRIELLKLPNELLEEDLTNEDVTRNNYSRDDNINFNDGDSESIYNERDSKMYDESNTLISDEARVYKGGSWLDRSYYLDPAQRRFLPEYMTTNFIGFRCAMSYLGSSRNITKPKKR